MGVKKSKPISSTRRFTVLSDFAEITSARPEKSLLKHIGKSGGRNSKGRISMRHRGGGHKRQYRLIDFKREKKGVPAKVLSIEYDPNRSARIALLRYADGKKKYIIAPQGLSSNDEVMGGPGAEPKVGHALPLRHIPTGLFIHNIELKKGKGAQIVRAAGTSAQLLAKEGDYAHVKLPSGEVRLIPLDCQATVGQVGNVDHSSLSLGKAGRKRWQGRRPHVRGVAMNPVDHPMGGGEGKSAGGRHPVTPWGKPTKGYKTRKKKKSSDRLIVKRRKRGGR